MRKLRRYLRGIDFRIPVPVAALILAIVLVGALVLVGTDWGYAGLPATGQAGRFDWAVSKYYRQWRLQRDASKARFLKQHPDYREFEHMTPEEIARQLKARAERKASP